MQPQLSPLTQTLAPLQLQVPTHAPAPAATKNGPGSRSAGLAGYGIGG